MFLHICRVKLLVLFLLFSFSFVHAEPDIANYVKEYKPYVNLPHTISDICEIYVNTLYYEGEIADVRVHRVTDAKFIVHVSNRVSEPRADVLQFSPELAKEYIKDAKDKLKMAWLVDMNNESVKPYDYPAQDSMNLFKNMIELLGYKPQEK